MVVLLLFVDMTDPNVPSQDQDAAELNVMQAWRNSPSP